jgi:alpha-galactosidase
MKKLLILFLCFLSANLFPQKFENLALTPPMGWNTWNKFGCNVNEKLIREAADALVSSGMKDAGYTYIVIDDCWHGERDSLGFIHENSEHFPSGMKALVDYVHSKGLKFGIYSCAGALTCAGKPGSRGHEYQDAITYASWGVDYLKYDWCYAEDRNAQGAYTTMRDALYSAGRPVVFSLCEWGNNKPWAWASSVGHLWRTTGDISAVFDGTVDHGNYSSLGVLYILDLQEGLRKYAGPGHWNDPDMLEVGNGLSDSENRAHFSMWCMLAAPLMAGNDIAGMNREVKAVLTNKDVIAVNQDSLGIQGFKYFSEDSLEIWFKPLKDGDWAMCLLNRKSTVKEVKFNWKDHVIIDPDFNYRPEFLKAKYSLTNLWAKKSEGTTAQPLKITVPPHDAAMYRLKKLE